MKQLNEGLKHLDMEKQVVPILGIDVYKSKIGSDSEIITLNFTVKQKLVALDLAEWVEKGYDWVIDADTSPGELDNGKYLTFVEINRKTHAPDRIVEMIADLEPLTGLKTADWQAKIGDQRGPLTLEFIKQHLVTDSNKYSDQYQDELNEWRETAGIETKKTSKVSEDLLSWQRQAGIK
jgi:hypothetical protein